MQVPLQASMKRRLFFSTLLYLLWKCCCVFPMEAQRLPRIIRPSLLEQAEKEVERTLSTMSLEEKVGQLIIPIISPSSSQNAIEKAKAELLGSFAGGILFQKGEAYEQWVMTRELQKSVRIPLLITADAEWGLAMRLSNTIRYPRNMALANVSDLSLVRSFGASMGQQCRVMGIHANFAPVLDVNNNPSNPVIGTRSFGEEKATVIRYGLAYSEGIESEGVLSVAKHFPGHGNTSVDSHHALPTIMGKKKELDELELAPFTAYFEQGFGGVMVGHLNVPALDNSGTPASMSRKITTTLLQEKMGFCGLVFTDGMQMKGMQQGGKHPIGVRALLAGNDFLLGPSQPVTTHKEILQAVQKGVIKEDDIEEKCRKVLLYKWFLMGQSLQKTSTPKLNREEFYARLNTQEARNLANELWWQSVKIERGEKELLPLSRHDHQQTYGIVDIYSSAKAPDTFEKTLRSIGIQPALHLQVPAQGKAGMLERHLDQLAQCSIVFINYHTGKGTAHSSMIELLAERTKVVFTLFASPYALKSWYPSLKKAEGIVCAYEACAEAQRSVASRLFNIDPNDIGIVQVPHQKREPQNITLREEKVHQNKPLSQGDLRFSALEKIVHEAVENGVFPGCQIVVHYKGKSVYNNAFGSIEGGKHSPLVDRNTIYDMASITKAMATTPVVMQLVARGILKLNDRVDKYVSEVKNTPVAGLTLKELLLHQSGLTPSINFYIDLLNPMSYAEGSLFSYQKKSGWRQIDRNTWVNPDIKYDKNKVSEKGGEIFSIPFGSHLFLHQSFKQEVFSKIGATPLKSKNTYRYSDVGFILIGAMVENATHQSLEQLTQELIYAPMGLKDLGYLPLNKYSDRQIAPTQEYCFLRGKLCGTVDDESAACLGGVAGNAGLFGTATDLAEVAEMLLHKGKYHGKEIIPSSTVHSFCSTRGVDGRRSLGFEIGRPGVNIPEGASPQTFGHSGFTGCIVWIDPTNELIFVFLSNRTYPTRLNTKLITQKTRLTLLESTYKALGIIS